MTPAQLDVCSAAALLCDDEDLSQRMIAAIEADDKKEAKHVGALMICLMYRQGKFDAARVVSIRWVEAF